MTKFAGYEAERNDAGHLVVKDVPIFLECERTVWSEKKQKEVLLQFDADWIKKAVANAEQRQGDDYHPPLHIRHHGFGDEVKRAGFFTITGARKISFKGKEKLAIMADLTITDWSATDDVMAMRLPYRSVEIHDADKPGIDSLALLDTEAPFLELPMLAIRSVRESGLERVAAGAAFSFTANRSGCELVGSYSQGARTALLFQADEERMNDDEDKKPPVEEAETESVEETPEVEEAKPEEVESVAALIESGGIPVKDFARIEAAMAKARAALSQGRQQQQLGQDGVAAAPTPGDAMAAKADTKHAAPETGDEKTTGDERTSEVAIQMAKKDAQNVALQQRIEKLEEANAVKADVDAAVEKLGNRPLGADPRKRLEDYRKANGAVAFKAHVDELHSLLAEDDDQDGGAIPSVAQGKFPDIAMKFQAHGADAVTQAATLAEQHAVLRRTGSTSLPLDRFVKLSMQNRGFELKD